VLFLFPAMGRDPEFSIAPQIGIDVKFSLRTSDERVAEVRESATQEHLARYYHAIENGPAPLTHRQLVALAGDVYRFYTEGNYETPGTADQWRAFKGLNRAVIEGRIQSAPPIIPGEANDQEVARELFGERLTAGINALPTGQAGPALEQRFGLLVDWVLTRYGLALDDAQRADLLLQIPEAAQLAARQLIRLAKRDYSPDPAAARFPLFRPIGNCSLSAIFDRWMDETHPSASTISSWRTVITSLRAHLGHEDMARLTTDNVVAWKTALQTKGLTAKTINDGYLTAIRSLLNFEVKNRRLPTNVATGILVQVKGTSRSKMLPYTNDEVARLLSLSAAESLPWCRWLPWLAALSGARIGELAQLWGSRVRLQDGFHVIDLRPAEDGGTFKNMGSERVVPLHPALIRDGFLEFVQAAGEGPLFYKRTSGNPRKKHASKGVTNRLAAWIRKQGFKERRKAPNHALRHWFKTVSGQLRIEFAVTDFIQGHAPRSDADGYRHIDLAMMAEAISRVVVPTIQTPLEEPREDAEALLFEPPTSAGRQLFAAWVRLASALQGR
jgi:integrase